MSLGSGTPQVPRVGLFVCFSGASNTGSLTGMAALEVVKRLGSAEVGICSLPALLNHVPRQTTLVRRIAHLMVIDGCHQSCASRLLADTGFTPELTLNLELDLGIQKQGPFTSLEFTTEDVERVADAIIAAGQAVFHWLPDSRSQAIEDMKDGCQAVSLDRTLQDRGVT